MMKLLTIFSSERPMRGITLLIAVILSTVVLTVAIALLDVTYKQVVLASSATESDFAFYAADTAMECALYYDQQQASFDYASAANSFAISCNAQSITVTEPTDAGGTGFRTATWSVPCAGGGTQASVTVSKSSVGSTVLYATGYSSCSATDPRRIERGLKVSY